MSDRFYTNSPLALGPVLLQGAEAHHLSAVCRLHPGDRVYLFNGDGRQYLAEIAACGRRHVDLNILAAERPDRELGFHLEVAAPLPKGDRGQFLIEKLTELGVTRFVPLRTRRSIARMAEDKLERWQRYVIEASKQCGRNVLMEVAPACDWSAYCRRPDLPAVRFVAHPGGTALLPPPGTDCSLAVGPEGGFDEAEIAEAQAAGWQAISLGSRILRVETAAITLAAWSLRPPGAGTS